MKRNIFFAMFALVLIGLCYGPAYAHDLVLIPAGPQELTVKFGHPSEYQPPDLKKLIQLNAYITGGNSPISLLNEAGKSVGDHATFNLQPLLHGSAVSIVTGEYDNGYWSSVSGSRYFNTSKLYLPNAMRSGYYFKYAKALFPAAAGLEFERALGERLEIVPLNDPFKLRPGQKLPVKVLYLGKPLAGIGVEIGDGRTKIKEADIRRYKTSPEGIALLPISKRGLQIVAVDYQRPPHCPQLSDHDDFGASLAFFVSRDAR